MLAGVLNLLKQVFRPIFKLLSLVIISSLSIAWIALFVSGHFALPFVPMITPDPSFTGYIAFYTAMISLGLIPIIWISISMFRRIWGWKQTAKYQTPLYGTWIVSFFIFLFTMVFTLRNFKESHSNTETLSGLMINKDAPLLIEGNYEIPDWHNRDVHVNLGPIRLLDDSMYIEENGMLNILPTTEEKGFVKKFTRSSGLNKSSAIRNAEYISHEFELIDNHLTFDNFYRLSRKGKFRLQQIQYEVYVPIGTKVEFVNRGTYRQKRNKNLFGYEGNHSFIMTKKGLEKLETETI